ncbi:MAG: hypothetical protein IK990_00045 [Ruminiclostridium sp.]|nr:hypothetical protein [Ruminiclostridium sp.]
MDKTPRPTIAGFLKDNAAPMLLSASVISSAAYIYAGDSDEAKTRFALISVVYALFLFAVYEFLRRTGKGWLSTIAVGAMFVASFSLGSRLLDMRNTNDLMLWFMEPSRYTEIHYGNTYALIAIMGFVLISCLYYFTRIRYKGVFVFLICLCPFCLFAKTFTDIPVIFPIIIMTLFFFIMTGNSGKTAAFTETGWGSLLSTAAFVLTVTVIASFMPKIDSAPFRENFDEFITGVRIGAPGNADFNDFSDSSSIATANDDDTVLFMFYGDNPEYVKRQCFNQYNISDNTWGYYGNPNEGSSRWERFTRFEDPSILYEAAGFESGSSAERTTWVRSASGAVHALYTPDNMTSVELYESDRKIFRTESDEYFVGHEGSDYVSAYLINWTYSDIDPEFTEMFTDELAVDISENGSSEAAAAAESYLRAKEEAEQYNELLLSDRIMDGCYSDRNARTRVRELAAEITSGCGSDFEKASALSDFFRGGEYIYDSEFTTSDGSPDYFIFVTKRGACAAYATAMTLMCRELGMTARYCEGFLVQKQTESGSYYFVTAADSHAFVQVWLDGYGWTVFDPTSAVTDGGYFDMTFIYVGAAALMIVLIGAVTVFLRPRVIELHYRNKMKASRGTAQYSMIYRKINKMINEYNGSKTNTLTPTDTASVCADLFGYDIGGFVQEYESAVYGGYADEKADNSAVYTGFVRAYREKLKEERKQKKKWRSLNRKR